MTIKITEGVIVASDEAKFVGELTAAFLKHNGVTGNPFLTPNFPAIFMPIPVSKCYTGGVPAKIAQIELRVPSFALTEEKNKAGWVADATEIVRRFAGDRLPPQNIWVNMVYGDDLWGVAGVLYTTLTLRTKIEAAA
jgi:hypothetical protein